MIYLLFTISFIIYITLNYMHHFYKFFNVETKLNNRKKENQTKYSFLLLKIIISSLFKKKKPNWILNEKKLKIKLIIIKGLKHFFIVFTIVSFIFCVLQFWIDNTTNYNKTTSVIYEIEKIQFKIKGFIDHFKFGSNYKILILFLLISMAVSFPIIEKYKLKNNFKKFNKYIKNIFYFLTISTTFTFFGNTLNSVEEKRLDKIEIYKLQLIKNNELLYKNIKDEVTERVIHEILNNKSFENALDDIEKIKQNINKTSSSNDYEEYVTIVPKKLLKDLPIYNFKKSFNKNYKFVYNFKQIVSGFEDNSSSNKRSNKKRYTEKNASYKSTQKAEESFYKAKKSNKKKYSKYYSRYKEPFEKLIKNTYKITGKNWLNNFIETIGLDIPLLDLFLDPIINKPIEEFITKKTDNIFKKVFLNNEKDIESELNKTTSEFKEMFDKNINESKKYQTFKNTIKKDLSISKKVALRTKIKIEIQYKKAKNNLIKLRQSNKWERIRMKFFDNLTNRNYPSLPKEAYDINIKALKKWNKHLKNMRYSIYFNSKKSIEPYFLNFIKKEPELLISWAYALLASGENNNLSTPYDALNYYFNEKKMSYQKFTDSKNKNYLKRMDFANEIMCGKK